MGKKITTEMTEAAYKFSKEVYEGRISKKDALHYLVNDYEMAKGSASDYIANFKKMIEGELYKRTNNPEATDYYLTNILKDYGSDKFLNAIKAAQEHLVYYSNLDRGSPQHEVRAVVNRHERIISEKSSNIYPDEVLNAGEVFEGAKKSVTVNIYERDAKARMLCIKEYGLNCSVCKFGFKETYGNIGLGFIHVHHLNPIHTIGKEYKIDPVKDLRPVCPNCHAMLHKRNPPYSIEELQEIMANHISNSHSAQ